MKILVTGSAGFIGYHLVKALLNQGHDVTGIDNINEYYDASLKFSRLEDSGISAEQIEFGKLVESSSHERYKFIRLDLKDQQGLNKLFECGNFEVVCNLAAQAGVRYSLTNPQAYLDSNIQGFLNILECCRHHKIKHLVYASSSSVYGLNKKMPFSTHHNVDHPISLYAASKKSNELMAHTYSYLFGLPTTGLRFFTVYGPWGRPDMAIFLFTKAIMEGKPIHVFNNGNMKRDFTHVNDIIDGIMRIIAQPPCKSTGWNGESPDPASSSHPYQIFNIGRGKSIKLLDFIEQLEISTSMTAEKIYMPLQDGDVEETWADINDLKTSFGYNPQIDVKEGISSFVEWYKMYYA
jgi:UDP-glucuronate 4-epimerase